MTVNMDRHGYVSLIAAGPLPPDTPRQELTCSRQKTREWRRYWVEVLPALREWPSLDGDPREQLDGFYNPEDTIDSAVPGYYTVCFGRPNSDGVYGHRQVAEEVYADQPEEDLRLAEWAEEWAPVLPCAQSYHQAGEA